MDEMKKLVEALRAGGHKGGVLRPWPGGRPSAYEAACPCGEEIELLYLPEEVVGGRAPLFARCRNRHLHGWNDVWADLPPAMLL
jgi:hypothetical protein